MGSWCLSSQWSDNQSDYRTFNTTLVLTGWSKRPDAISQQLLHLLSWLYSTNCSCGKEIPNPFYFKCTWRHGWESYWEKRDFGYPGYDTKWYLMLRLQSCCLENVEYPFISITLRFTLTLSEAPVRVWSIGQIELFNHLLGAIIIIISYLILYCCVQIIYIT